MKRETLAHFVHMATGLGRFIGSQPFCGVLGFILDDMSDLVHSFARDFFEPNATLSGPGRATRARGPMQRKVGRLSPTLLRPPFMNQAVHLIPRFCARFSQRLVGTICEADCIEPIGAKAFDVIRRVINVYVRTDLFFILHEAKVPVWNSVLVKPLDSLRHSEPVKKVNEKPMSDNPNTSLLIG